MAVAALPVISSAAVIKPLSLVISLVLVGTAILIILSAEPLNLSPTWVPFFWIVNSLSVTTPVKPFTELTSDGLHNTYVLPLQRYCLFWYEPEDIII